MKKAHFVVLLVIVASLVLGPRPATAITHYSQNEFTTAESLDPGMTQTGVHFSLGEHFKSYYPEVRYGLGGMMEIGIKAGATSNTVNTRNELGVLVGADLKYQLVKQTDGIPIDLAVDVGLDNTIINSRNASELTFATIVSRSYPLTDRGYAFIPYGGLAMSALEGSLPEQHDSYMNGFAGFVWKISQKFMLLMEIKAGDSMTGGAGIRFEY